MRTWQAHSFWRLTLYDTSKMVCADHVKLVKLWSTYSTQTFRETVQAVHQQITVRILVNGYQERPEEPDEDPITGLSMRRHIEDDDVIPDAVRFLRLVFYASLLGSIADSPEHADVKRRERDAEQQFADFCEQQRLQADQMLEDPQVFSALFSFFIYLRKGFWNIIVVPYQVKYICSYKFDDYIY